MNTVFGKKKRYFTGPVVIGVIILLIVSAVVMGRFFKSEEKIKMAFKNGQTISFLLATYTEDKNIHGVSVIFLNTRTNRVSLVSILPKTYISFGKDGYLTLEESISKNITWKEIRTAVSGLIGTEINYYVFVQKKNIIRLIDMLGGIEIYTDEIKLPQINVSIPEGTILLDGDKSIEYLSYLENDDLSGQYDKLKRIQNYISGFIKLPESFIETITVEAVTQYIYRTIDYTDITMSDFVIIYDQIRQKYETGITDYSPGIQKLIVYSDKKLITGYDYIYLPKKSGSWIQLELTEALENIEKEFVTDVTGAITLTILNGTEVNGLAGRAKRHLRGFGFDVIEIGNANSTEYDSTLVISHGNEKKARKLGDLIRCDTIVENKEDISTSSDVTLIIGRDFDGKKVIR